MACPLPSEFAAIVPVDPDNPSCEELREIMLVLPVLLERWWSCWFNPDGTLTDEFTAEICALPCGSSTSSSTT